MHSNALLVECIQMLSAFRSACFYVKQKMLSALCVVWSLSRRVWPCVHALLGSAPHFALTLVALGPLHTPSELADLRNETARLQAASALGKHVLARRLGVTEFTVSDFLYDHCMTIESGHSNLAPCRRACH